MKRTLHFGLLLIFCATAILACDKDDESENEGRVLLEEENLYQTEHVSDEDTASRDLRGVLDSSRMYYDREHINPTGGTYAHQFPGSAPRTPDTIPCGERIAYTEADWQHPTWRALSFQPTQPIRFSYQYDSSGTGVLAHFTITAFGDSNCDGTLGIYQKHGSITSDGRVQGSGTWDAVNVGE